MKHSKRADDAYTLAILSLIVNAIIIAVLFLLP